MTDELPVIEIVFRKPNKKERGFMRKNIEFLRLVRRIKEFKDDPDPDVLMAMIERMASYIVKPTNRQEAIDALLDASEEEFENLMDTLGEVLGGNNIDPNSERG